MAEEGIQDEPYSATVGAGGTAQIIIRPQALASWIVSQVSIEMATAPLGATAAMRKNGRFITYMIPTGDAAGGDPPVPLTPGDRLTVDFAGCTPGDQATATVLYTEGRR